MGPLEEHPMLLIAAPSIQPHLSASFPTFLFHLRCLIDAVVKTGSQVAEAGSELLTILFPLPSAGIKGVIEDPGFIPSTHMIAHNHL